MGAQGTEWINGCATEIANDQIDFANERLDPAFPMTAQVRQDTVEAWKRIIGILWKWLLDVQMDNPGLVPEPDPTQLALLRQVLQPAPPPEGE